MAPLSRDEARRERARRGQANAMKGRQCPACGRGNALKRTTDAMGAFRSCRYCGFEDGVMSQYEVRADPDGGITLGLWFDALDLAQARGVELDRGALEAMRASDAEDLVEGLRA